MYTRICGGHNEFMTSFLLHFFRKGWFKMPKNRFQETIFTIMMVIVMVYGLVCYNISLDKGGMSNFIFLAALSELPIMGVAGFVLDTFIAGPIAKKKAAKLVNPKRDNPFMMVLAISVFSVLFMCPMMSFVATILFKGAWGPEVIAVWLETTVKNFPMAFFWQLMIAGPLVRGIFGKIFAEKKNTEEARLQEG